MNNAKKLTFLACLATLAACKPSAPSAPAPDIASSVMADQFCAGDYKPWQTVMKACVQEKTSGAPGANCDTLWRFDSIIDKRRRASSFEACRFEVRWGANAANK